MGIISNGRCCGRNIVFDLVTGGGGEPPPSNFPCYYRSQLFDLPFSGIGSALTTPLGTFPTFQVYSDLTAIKDVYESLSMSLPAYPLGSSQFYWYIMDVDGTLDLDGWLLNWEQTGDEPIVWEQLSCGGEFTEGCYTVDFNFDTGTNPIGAINFVNGLYVQEGNPMYLDPIGNGSSWAEVNASLTQILRMMFNTNSTLDATITDNGGGSFTLIITGMGSFPTAPPTIGIAYDYTLPSEDQTLNLTPFTCP